MVPPLRRGDGNEAPSQPGDGTVPSPVGTGEG